MIFGEDMALLEYKLDRRDDWDRVIKALTVEPVYREAVGSIGCLKGMSTQAAMVLVTEIGSTPYPLAICPGVLSPAKTSSTTSAFNFGVYLRLAISTSFAPARHCPGQPRSRRSTPQP